ncbi:MAG: hypothetical protein IJZ00_10865 [Lachnospiraceae bacterium]|nr:hypothetical protein [Lachnospiraceae bacterium]
MSKFLRILIGTIIIILLSCVSLFLLSDGNIEGEAVLFVIFVLLIPLALGCIVGMLLMRIIEKSTELAYNSIKFYIGVPCCIFMAIAITLFTMFG